MRRFTLAALLAAPLAVAAVAAPAAAQDGAAPFTGVHVDGLAGWDNIQNHGHSNDFMYGVGAGYDVALGNGIRVGIDGEVADSNNKSCFGSKTVADPRFCAKAGRDLYVGGRVGTVVGGKTLLYAKAGYTNAQAKLTSDDGTARTTLGKTNLDGIRVGAGAEYAVGSNAYVKTEYRYSNYQDGFSRHQVVAGFGLRF